MAVAPAAAGAADAPDVEAANAPAAVAAGRRDVPGTVVNETQVGRSDDVTAARDKRAGRTAIDGANREASGDQAPDEEEVAVLPALPQVPEPSEAAAATLAQVFGKANTDSRIIIRAKHESWVQVRDRDGELVLTRMLHAGDTYRVPNREGLRLLTGNAGGLEIFVDGRLAPPIGPRGAIRRDVALDVERLLQGTAVGN
jgi:cytoskeleton protein RodZ